MNKLALFFKQNAWLAGSIVLTILACVVSIALRLFSAFDLPFQAFAALLGVIITAIITQILLIGQTKSDVTREKDAKIFEEKLKIYQDFLNTLCEVVSDHKLSYKDILIIQFKTSYMAMHTSTEHIKTISENIQTIIKATCPGEKSEAKPNPIILDSLFKIIKCFQDELYETSDNRDKTGNTKKKEELFKQTIENFKEAYDTTGGGKYDDTASRRNPSSEVTETIAISWDDAKKKWQQQGWETTEREDKSYVIRPLDKEKPAYIELGFENNKVFIAANYDPEGYGGVELAKVLKKEYKGRRSYGLWWRYLDEYPNLNETNFDETFKTDTKLQQALTGLFNELILWVDSYHRTKKRLEAITSDGSETTSNWNISIDYACCVRCVMQNEQRGNPVIDVYDYITHETDDEIKIVIYNQTGNQEQIADLCQGKTERDQDNRVVLEKLKKDTPIAEVATRIKYWLTKIDKSCN